MVELILAHICFTIIMYFEVMKKTDLKHSARLWSKFQDYLVVVP